MAAVTLMSMLECIAKVLRRARAVNDPRHISDLNRLAQDIPACSGFEFHPAPPHQSRASDTDYILGPRVPHKSIVVLAAECSMLHEQIGWLSSHTREVKCCTDPGLAHFAVRKGPGHECILVVDLDLFEDLDEATDFLINLREEEPELAAVIASVGFSSNDFSLERVLIADASVRLPTSRVTLGLAMSAAVSNNRNRMVANAA